MSINASDMDLNSECNDTTNQTSHPINDVIVTQTDSTNINNNKVAESVSDKINDTVFQLTSDDVITDEFTLSTPSIRNNNKVDQLTTDATISFEKEEKPETVVASQSKKRSNESLPSKSRSDENNWRITDENKNVLFDFEQEQDEEFPCILPASANWYCSSILSCLNGYFAVGGKNAVFIGNLRKATPVIQLDLYPCTQINMKVTACSFMMTNTADDNGDLPANIAISTDDGLMRIYETSTRKMLKEHRKHTTKVTALSWSPLSSHTCWSADDRGNLCKWNLKENLIQVWTPLPVNISSMELCSTQNWIAIGYFNGNVIIGDSKKMEVLQTFKSHLDEVTSLSWCSYVKHGVPLLASGSKDRSIRTWDVNLHKPVATYSIPRKLPGVKSGDSMAKNKAFQAVMWLDEKRILSGYPSGELLCWNTCDKGKFQVIKQIHNRPIFSICKDEITQRFVTVSMDRQVVVWNSLNLRVVQAIPSFGGFVYSLSATPIDPHKIAIGVGDQQIRVWSTGDSHKQYDTKLIWQGIRSKVLVVKFHPSKEGLLAFGTDDGHVGCASVLSQKSDISASYHKKGVYSLSWGPCCSLDEETEDPNRCKGLFSVGGEGGIFMHKLGAFNQDATDIGKLIRTVNQFKSVPLRSDICWRSDMNVVAIGNEDGSIDVFHTTRLLHVCTINFHKKMINCMCWHHDYALTTNESAQDYSCWLASGSNEETVCVHDLSTYLLKTKESSDSERSNQVTISTVFRQLNGHTSRITSVSWNPHKNGCLASSSYDGSIQIWDVVNSEPIANYRGHIGRVYCVLWSFQNTDVVFSGGEDFTLRRWKISETTFKTPPSSSKKSKGRNKKAKKIESSESLIPSEPLLTDSNSCSSTKETVLIDNNVIDNTVPSVDVLPTVRAPAATAQVLREMDKKKRKGKSLLKLSSVADSKKKEEKQIDCINLAKYLKAESVERGSGKLKAPIDPSNPLTANLGFYGTRKDVFQMVNTEIVNHYANGTLEQATHLEVWQHNINGVINKAYNEQQLTETMVALSPLGGIDMWKATTLAFAEQQEAKRNFHQASLYYLAVGDVKRAIHMFLNNGIFREALALAKMQLSREDPLINQIYMQWASKLTEEGNFESAAECLLAADCLNEAISVLAKRGDSQSILSAIQVADVFELKNRVNEYLPVCLNLLLEEQKWDICQELFINHESTPVFRAQAIVGELLIASLKTSELTTSENSSEEKNLHQYFTKKIQDVPTCTTFLSKVLHLLDTTLGVNVLHYNSFDNMNLDTLCSGKLPHNSSKQQILHRLLNLILLGITQLLKRDTNSCFKQWLLAFELLVETGHHASLHDLFEVLFPSGMTSSKEIVLKFGGEISDNTEDCFKNFLAFSLLDELYSTWWNASISSNVKSSNTSDKTAASVPSTDATSTTVEVVSIEGTPLHSKKMDALQDSTQTKLNSYISALLLQQHIDYRKLQTKLSRANEQILEIDIKKRLYEHKAATKINKTMKNVTCSSSENLTGTNNGVVRSDIGCLSEENSSSSSTSSNEMTDFVKKQSELISQRDSLIKSMDDVPDHIKLFAFPNPEHTVLVLLPLCWKLIERGFVLDKELENIIVWIKRNDCEVTSNFVSDIITTSVLYLATKGLRTE